jgi:hypothetical protein
MRNNHLVVQNVATLMTGRTQEIKVVAVLLDVL